MPLLIGEFPPFSLFYELMEGTSPIHSHAGLQIFLLSVFLCRLDEPIKLFPSVVIKMMLIHFQFYLMPTPGYLCWHCNKPINKTAVLLPVNEDLTTFDWFFNFFFAFFIWKAMFFCGYSLA